MDKDALYWTTLNVQPLLSTRIFTVEEAHRCHASGAEGRFVIINAPDWVTVIPVVSRGGGSNFIMVRQYRHGSGSLSLEFPSGIVDEGEDPAAAGGRELMEETGLTAGSLVHIGSVNP